MFFHLIIEPNIDPFMPKRPRKSPHVAFSAQKPATWALLTAALCFSMGAPTAHAQISKLDPGVLIDGLRRDQMDDLLQYLGETDKNMSPQASKQLYISQLLRSYFKKKVEADKSTDPDKATELRKAGYADFKKAAEERLKLIAAFPNDENCPVWQTDLAEQMIFEDLQVNGQSAAEFYEFGIPTAEQKALFESITVQLIQQLSLADLNFNKLVGELSIKPDHTELRINTGWWERWLNQYYKLRTQYFLAYASYYTTLLPPTHNYWKTVGADPKIGVLQKRTADEERKRLLEHGVLERLQPFINDKTDPFEIRRPSMLLAARAHVALKHFDDARKLLGEIGDAADDIHGLVANLTLAELDGSTPKTEPLAMQRLGEVAQKGIAHSSLLYRVLIVDQTHRMRMRDANAGPADKRAEATAAAYEPYQKLLNDSTLAPEMAAALKEFIYSRWESSIPENADLSITPPIVVAAIGEIARNRGQYLKIKSVDAVVDANDAKKAADDAAEEYKKNKTPQNDAKARELAAISKQKAEEAAKAVNPANAKLNRAIKVNADLLKRAGLDEIVAGQALYNQAVAQYFLDQLGEENQLKTAVLLEQLAREHPKHPQAEDAITNAIKLMFPLRRTATPGPGVIEVYRKVARTLLDKFPNTQAAIDERLYYVETELIAYGRLEEAAEILSKTPQAHRDYISAQGLYIYCLFELFRKAPVELKDVAPTSTPAAATPAPAAAPPAAKDAKATAAPKPEAAPAPPALTKTKAQYAQILRTEAPRVAEVAETAMTSAPADQVSLIRRVGGWARLRFGDVLIEDESAGNDLAAVKKRVADALAVIFAFEDKYKDEPDLMREMLARRITWLFKIGKFEPKSYDDGVIEAGKMMERFPDDAASIIDTVVTELERNIDDLRDKAAKSIVDREKKELLDDADKKGAATTKLARLLHEWGEKKYVELKTKDKAKYLESMLPFKLLMAKSLRLGRLYQDSLDMLADYDVSPKGAYGDNGAILLNLAESYFGLANLKGHGPEGDPLFVKAAGFYNKLIAGLRPENNVYPPAYWNAWMRSLQIMDAMGQNLKDIPLRVQQLQMSDPNLGGEPYISQMKRLEIKHSGN
jgi:hypothetical protein